MEIEPLVKELLDAGVHFGHQTRRWNPKMKRFIFAAKNGIYLLDLEKTASGLKQAQDFLRKVASEGGPILFVGTKRQAQPIVAEEAIRCGQYYVNYRWMGGMLTNFQTVKKSIDRLKTLQTWKEDGTFDAMTKKEAALAQKEMDKLFRVLKGIAHMPRLPKAIYLIDAKREETAIKEAARLGIPVVGLVDTNSDPDPIAYVIPGNDDAIRSIQLVTRLMADAVIEGQQAYLAGVAEKKAAADAILAEKAAAEEAAAAAVAARTIDQVEEIVPESTLKAVIDPSEGKKKGSSPVKSTSKE